MCVRARRRALACFLKAWCAFTRGLWGYATCSAAPPALNWWGMVRWRCHIVLLWATLSYNTWIDRLNWTIEINNFEIWISPKRDGYSERLLPIGYAIGKHTLCLKVAICLRGRECGEDRKVVKRKERRKSTREADREAMNSYFANSSLPCHLSAGQEVLPNVSLSSSGYDPVRHFSSYNTPMSQNRIYASPFYSPQDNVFRAARGPYDCGSNIFLQEKDVLPSCRQTTMGLNSQNHVAQDYSLESARNVAQEQKGNLQIYPWMQRMNSHTGKFFTRDWGREWAAFTIYPGNTERYFLWAHKAPLNGWTIKAFFQRGLSHLALCFSTKELKTCKFRFLSWPYIMHICLISLIIPCHHVM